jgi:histidinol-phosphate aminotransferase
MFEVPKHIQNIKTYKPGKPIQEIRREFNLEKIAKLGSNENTLGASPKAVEAMKNAMNELQWYPEPACIDSRNRFAEHLGLKREQIIIGNGSEGILSYAYKAFTEPGDELITCKGSFIGVYVLAEVNNLNQTLLNLKEDYTFNLNGILDSISHKTKMIYLANPNNPTGTIIKKHELEAFMAKVPEHILVILDEAYYEFANDLSAEYPEGLDYKYQNLLCLRTFSKAYGLAGVRFGYGYASEKIIEALMKVKLPFEPSVIAQAAGIGALSDTDFLAKTLEMNRNGMQYFYNEFEKLGLNYTKSYANFVMVDFETEDKVNDLNAKLLETGVIVRPLVAFGLAHCIRFTVGQSHENEMAIEKLKLFL